MRWMRGATAVLLVSVVACSSSDGPPGADNGPQQAADTPPAVLQEVSVIGAGRASQAASTVGAAMVVGTTIGVSVVDANGAATTIGSEVESPVSDVTVSPDGRYATVEGQARTELWSVEAAPALVTAFDTPTHSTFTIDGSLLMTSSPLEVTIGPIGSTPPTVIEAPAGTEFGTATMTPDGQVIAAPVTGDGPDLVTYTAPTGTAAADIFVEPGRKILRADFGGRADRLVLQVSSSDPFEGQLVAWDAGVGQTVWETATGTLTPGTPWDVGLDGRVLTGDGTTLRLLGLEGNAEGEWPLDATQTVTAIEAIPSGYAVALSDGTLLLTGLDGVATGSSVQIGRQIVDLEPLAGADGVITVDAAGSVQAWAPDGTLLREVTAYRAGAVNDVALSADGSEIAAATTAGTATVTTVSGSEPLLLEHPEGNVDSVAFAPAGDRVVTGVGERLSDVAFNDTVSTWNLADGLRIAQSGGEGEDVNGCANFRNTVRFSPNGELFASASHDFTVEVHRGDTSEIVATLAPHASTVLDVVFSPTGDRLVTSSDDGVVRVWSTTDFALQSEFVGPPGGYWSLAFMPDGGSLIASDLTGMIRRIDVATGAEILAFEGVTTRTGRLAVSPDGTLVAAASDGNSIGIWSTETGLLTGSVEGHRSPVTSAAFSSDGSTLVTGSGDTTVRIWRVVQD